MRNAIQQYTEMKIALIQTAQEISKETFKKEADIKKIISKKYFKSEYIRVTNIIVQRLIDEGIISDILELAKSFRRNVLVNNKS